MPLPLVSFFLLSISTPARLAAQMVQSSVTLKIPFLEQAPRIDGVLDDPAWQKAAKVTTFAQVHPKEGVPTTEDTAAYIGYDKDNLYIAFYAKDSQPSRIRAHLAPRDSEPVLQDDWVGFLLDAFGDQRRSYEFFSNPLGVQIDLFALGDREDIAPDFVWYTSGKVLGDGYVVGMKVPFKSLRFPKETAQHWRLYLVRNIQRKNEQAIWPASFINKGSFFSQMADVQGVSGIKTGHRLEIIPEFTASKATPYDPQRDSFHWNQTDMRAGANVRYGFTPNWTLDSTYNPDFSQVEADQPQIQVNQRFPLFFPEKRPFFMEGADLFSTPLTIVHTRTIVDPLYGFKLTGKDGPYAAGVLTSRDRSQGGSTFDIARVKRDIGQESILGMIYSGRELPAGQYNRTAGLDGNFRFKKLYTFTFQGIETFTNNSSTGSTTGPAYHFSLGREAKEFQFRASYDDLSPNLEVDSGFFRRVDIRQATMDLSYNFWQSSGTLIRWAPSAGYLRTYNHAGTWTDQQPYAGLDFTFPLQTQIEARYYPSTLERFGGINFNKRKGSFIISAEPTKFLAGFLSVDAGDQINYTASMPFLGTGIDATASLTLKPTTRLSINQVYLKSRLNAKSGGTIFDENIYRTKIVYQWTKEISSRIIYQYSTLEHQGFADALLTYLLVPGTAMHVGYDLSFARTASVLQKTKDTFFTKLSYLFRI